MIDIDKYEGHTKHGEDWKYYWTQGNGGDNWTMINIKRQDALLLRDAPLLLEEVKRLRDKLFEAEIHIDPLTDDYTFENDIKELHYIEEVKE